MVAVQIPAAAICDTVKSGNSDTATAAMDFIGWTGIGVPNRIPVVML